MDAKLMMMGDDEAPENPVDNTIGALIDAAVAYADRGWRVVPLAAGRRPLVDLERINTGRAPGGRDIVHWWQVWPYAAVGIATGRSSGLVVVSVSRDVRRRPRGITPLGSRRAQDLTLPETAIVVHTTRMHHYFSGPRVAVPTCDIGGVQIFGEGGIVVAPPSHSNSTLPAWARPEHGGDLPLPPDWVCALAQTPYRE